MSVLKALTDAIRDSSVEVIDLTAPLTLARLPATGAVVVTGPLPIVGGSGSPCRAIALVERS
jgi:hypothetical protein